MDTQELLLKLKRFPLVAVAVVAVLAGAVSGYFRMDRIPTLQAEEEKLDTEIERMRTNTRRSKDLGAHMAALTGYLDTLEPDGDTKGRLLEPDNITSSLTYLYGLAEKAGVQVKGNPERTTIPTLVKGKPNKRDGRPVLTEFSVIQFKVIVNGNFEAVQKFFHLLETGNYFARVDKYKITPGRLEAQKVEANLEHVEILAVKSGS